MIPLSITNTLNPWNCEQWDHIVSSLYWEKGTFSVGLWLRMLVSLNFGFLVSIDFYLVSVKLGFFLKAKILRQPPKGKGYAFRILFVSWYVY